jgi:hypothetical protein
MPPGSFDNDGTTHTSKPAVRTTLTGWTLSSINWLVK